jgi:hypothetical protein
MMPLSDEFTATIAQLFEPHRNASYVRLCVQQLEAGYDRGGRTGLALVWDSFREKHPELRLPSLSALPSPAETKPS